MHRFEGGGGSAITKQPQVIIGAGAEIIEVNSEVSTIEVVVGYYRPFNTQLGFNSWLTQLYVELKVANVFTK